jgi:Integral membrane protein (PIN domain superfamily)
MDRPIVAAYRTGLITDTLAVPQFVLDELHALAEAEAPDPVSSRRARRALELLDALSNEGNELQIIPDEVPEFDSVALKISTLADRYHLRVASSSKETASAIQANGGRVVDLRSVVNEMSPTHLAGEHLRIDLVRNGTQPLQAVGYLPDGDMVVVNNASHRIGEKDVDVVIQTSRITSQGLLIFARLAEE